MKERYAQALIDALPVADHIKRRIGPDASGCWLWTGPLDADGYGKVSLKDKTRIVHRVVYEAVVGPVPKGCEIDHASRRGCKHRHCCNPTHLEPVTHHENILRGKNVLPKKRCDSGHLATAETARRCSHCQRIYAARVSQQRRRHLTRMAQRTIGGAP